MRYNLFLIVGLIVGFLVAGNLAEAYVASSDNYALEKDSLNIGGGELTSDSYGLGSTVGEVGTGDLSSDSYDLRAGYRAMESDVEVFLTVSSPDDVGLSSISEGGGSSSGEASWTVATNNSAGYRLSVKASTNPTLKNSTSGSFSDYAPGVDPSYDWAVAEDTAAFGFAVTGDDVTDRFKNNGSSCGSGSANFNYCWTGFSTSNQTIAEGTTANNPAGAATTLKLQAEVGPDAVLGAGSYEATLTVTAITL
ncbi:MAG: hypothetical protein A2589_01440 [Candidatus Vogelbacteria bacterium RIFOXYD1_FULL_46_19]|uniref:Uncharacterized protein n=1 Tax=Candidatus Vogelbacteria bacterium RIFOXYD1_FULL_46_19 TaxID=1802439 RepID=A0A1G2QGI3_9BACT|nr:MAG: hypothetical protein A2589_01440 [Candidatus Vogelbacteria bacterium RIFOXYD1_FULL_46_19]